MISAQEIIDSKPDYESVRIRRLGLFNGTELKDVRVEERAPKIQGFLAIATRIKPIKNNNTVVEATKYINLSCIAEMVIDNEVLKYFSPSYFMPETEIKIKR